MAENDDVDSTQSSMAIGRIEGKLDTFTYRLDDTTTDVRDHETRIRAIEKWVWGIPASVLIAISGVVAVLIK